MERDAAAKLQWLMDREGVRDAILRYTRGLDREDEALLLSAFHDYAADDHGAFIGKAVDFPSRKSVTRKRWKVFQHYVTNQSIEVVGDEAHCESYFMAMLMRPDGAIDLTGGRYVDRLERNDPTWAIADRGVIVEWAAGFPSGGPSNIPADLFLQGMHGKGDPSYARPFKVTRSFRDLEP